jgi:hypothetical protein
MSLKIIKTYLREGLEKSDIWYHGTPDVRELEKEGGFSNRETSIKYIKDLDAYNAIQQNLKTSRENGDDDAYHKNLDMVSKTYGQFKMRKPIFITNDSSVARTYANAKRAFDYQDAVEKLLKVKVNTNKGVKIVASGDRFRFIDTNKVKRGFVSAGVSEDEFNTVLNQFNYYTNKKDGIKTDMIAAIGEWFGFDFIDVVGVLDSYEGGSIKSTVRMVFNPKDITII